MGLNRSRLLIPGAYVPVAGANTITSPRTKNQCDIPVLILPKTGLKTLMQEKYFRAKLTPRNVFKRYRN